jgi:retron-type reverse transcriptase
MVKVHNICESIRNGRVVLLVLLDLSAAFDTVNHDLLLATLNKFKIGGTALQWLQSYLTEQNQVVRLNGETSDFKILKCGVPQGSVLGPLLFSIYTSTLRSKGVCYHLYADDTQIYLAVDPSQLHEGIARMEDCGYGAGE